MSHYRRFSGSAGLRIGGKGGIRVHRCYALDRPYTFDELKRWGNAANEAAGAKIVDTRLFQAVQVHYTAAPLFRGCEDPLGVDARDWSAASVTSSRWRSRPRRAARKPNASAKRGGPPKGKEASLLLHDPAVAFLRDHPTEVSYPLWWAIATNLARVDGGDELFHWLSSLDPDRYDRAAAGKLLDTAREANQPCTVDYIESLGFEGYRYWPLRHKIKAPVCLRHADPDLIEAPGGLRPRHDLGALPRPGERQGESGAGKVCH